MNNYAGSDFDDFLEQEGILDKVKARARKRLLALQLHEVMEEYSITKTELAERLETSRSQSDRLLDPDNTAVLSSLWSWLARAVGKQLKVELARVPEILKG